MFDLLSLQVLGGSSTQKKRSRVPVPPSNIATRSRIPCETEDGASDVPMATADENTAEELSPTHNITSRDSSSPQENQIVNVQQQGNKV